jgi:uncharacterized protein involved in exopolysaccharide biosynthesis
MPEPLQYETGYQPYGRVVFSLRDFFYVLFRHKKKIISFFLTVTIAVTLGTFWATQIYRTDAKLMVRIGRETATLDPTAATGQVMPVIASRESEVNSEIEILKSRELAEKVVDTFGPKVILEGSQGQSGEKPSSLIKEKLRELSKPLKQAKKELGHFLVSLGVSDPLSDRDEAIIEFKKKFAVEVQKSNNILFLSYEGPEPRLSQNILKQSINFYLEKHITVYRTSGSYEFFDKQSDQLRNEVYKTAEELKKLKSKTGVASLEEQRKILMNRIGGLQQENEATQAALAISRARIQELNGKLAGLSPTLVTQETTGTGNLAADQMRSRLYELQLKEQEILSKYTENSTLVKELRRQIAEAQALLKKEEPTRTQITTGINMAYQDLNLELIKESANRSSLEAKASVIKSQLGDARSEIAELNHTEVMMVGLQRELSLLDAKYRKYSENMEQARIDQALLSDKISNISVVQDPITSPEAISPRKVMNIAVGIFLGIFGGIGLAFVSEYLDHSLKKPGDVEEKLNLATLASIPLFKK